MTNEVLISVDVETDGPIPGPHSMLSIGASAFRSGDFAHLGFFGANLLDLPGAEVDPKTMAWWKTQPVAWDLTRHNRQDPAEVMTDFVSWCESRGGKPVFCGYPAAWDFSWVYWYCIRFVGRSPFSHSALDIKTLAMAMVVGEGEDTGYRDVSKRSMPKRWFDGCGEHRHSAVEDAHEQGVLLCNMLRELRAKSEVSK